MISINKFGIVEKAELQIYRIDSLACNDMILLFQDDWDDYHYETTFRIRYYDKNGRVALDSYIRIYCKELEEKIITKNKAKVDEFLKRNIEQLDDSFCSLGCNLDYYIQLKKCLPNEYRSVLRRLNDIAYDRNLWERFKDCNGVKKSLLRFSNSIKAQQEAFIVLEGIANPNNSLSFSYKASVPYDSYPITLNFTFEKESVLPHRINALVGKNGTGKTSILKKLAADLSGYTKRKVVDNSLFLGGKRPAFDKVISISYSAFDPFTNKDQQEVNSYVYCGIHSVKPPHKVKSVKEIRQDFIDSISQIKERGRYEQWKKIITELLNDSIKSHDIDVDAFLLKDMTLSSGESILRSSMTEVIAKIDKESIILFDEPEIHLHPNAIANVMRMFNSILEEFDSYAIIATHSPIILQELPSKNIIVLDRMDDQLFTRTPEIECFGENVSLITRDIFDVTSKESFYQSFFTRLKEKGKTKEEIEELFDDNLSLNATVFLESLYR